MLLTDAEHRTLLDWIDVSAQLRKVTHAAKQAELVEQLRTLAAEHKATADQIAMLEEKRAERDGRASALEKDVAARTATIAKMEGRLNSGEGLTSRDLIALQGDIETARTTRGQVEDEQLRTLGDVEDIDAELEAARGKSAQIAARGRDLQTERKTRAAELDAAAADLATQRAQQEAALPDAVRQAVKAREAAGGAGAAVIVHGTCGACGAALSGMARDRIAGAEPGETTTCEDCETLLIRPLG